jgi:hypothetical protein
MKTTKVYILEGHALKENSEIEILNEEEYNNFLFDSNGNSISKETIDKETDAMLKSFESDTAFSHTNFGDLNIKDEMRKFIISKVAQFGIMPSKEECLDYILSVNARNL